MSLAFEHVTQGQRVRFGTGKAAVNVAAEVDRLGARRVLLVAGGSDQDRAGHVTSGIAVAARCRDVRPHVPRECAERARAQAAETGADLLVSVGGGSTTGLAKAVALTTGLPIVAVPTTYAGSEATDVWDITEDGRKTTGTDARVLPTTVVYDAELTLSLPVGLSVASGCNALAHCVDALWGPRVDPIDRALATEAAGALAAGLPAIHAAPDDVDGHERVLYGAYLAAVAFASAGSGLHHKICHVLGGAYDLPHAATHAAVLPYVLAFNGPRATDAAARIAAALGDEHTASSPGPRDPAADAVSALTALYRGLGVTSALRDVGLAGTTLAEAARLVLPAVPPSNPRPVTEDDLLALLTAAWAGEDPARTLREGADA